jgi:hypothetical protein
MAANAYLIEPGQQLIVQMPAATRALPTWTPAPTAEPTEVGSVGVAIEPSPTAVATAQPPVFDPDAALAFASNWDGDWELFLAYVGGDRVVQLTDNDTDDLAPAWSPDGTRLAFASNRGGDWDIYVLDLACLDADVSCKDTAPMQITDAPSNEQTPAWAGRYVVYESDREANQQLYFIDLDTMEERILITSSADIVAPAWRP